MSETTKETCNAMRRLLEATQLAATDCSTIVVTIAVRTLWPFIHDAEELRRVEVAAKALKLGRDEARERIEELERERDIALDRAVDLEAKNKKLLEIARAKDERIEILNGGLTVLRESRDRAREQVDELRGKCPEYGRTIEKKNAEIATLDAKLVVINAKLIVQQAEINTLTMERDEALQRAKRERDEALQRAKRESRLVQVAHASAAARLEIKNERVAELEATNASLVTAVNAGAKRVAELEECFNTPNSPALGEGGDDGT